MIELFTKLVSKELSMCTPHRRTLVDRINNCNLGVVLFPNHCMITAPCYLVLLFNYKKLAEEMDTHSSAFGQHHTMTVLITVSIGI